MENYKNKYVKYKSKYQQLKKSQSGGALGEFRGSNLKLKSTQDPKVENISNRTIQ